MGRVSAGTLAAPTDRFREEFMFGLAEGMPRWAGYRLGFEIVNEYLETHPDLQVKAWTLLPAREFLEAFRDGRQRTN